MEYLPDMPGPEFSWQYRVCLESRCSRKRKIYICCLTSVSSNLDICFEFKKPKIIWVLRELISTIHITSFLGSVAIEVLQVKEFTWCHNTKVVKQTVLDPHWEDRISPRHPDIHLPVAYPSLVDLQRIHNESTRARRQVDVESIPLTSWRESVLYQYFRDGCRSCDIPSLVWRVRDEETNLEDVMQAAAVLEISFFVRPAGERVSCPECGYNNTDDGSPYIFGWIRCAVCRKLFWAAVFPLYRAASGGRLIDDDRYTEETSIADTTTPHVTADFVIVAHQGQAHPIPYAMARSETILLFGDITIHSTLAHSRSSSVHSVRSQWSIISPNGTSTPSSTFCMVEHDASDDDNYSVISLASEPPSPGVGPGLGQCLGGAYFSDEHIKRLVEGALASGQGPVYIGCSFTVINGDNFNGPISHANVGGYKNNNRVHNVTQLNSQVSTIPVPRLNRFARTVVNFMRG